MNASLVHVGERDRCFRVLLCVSGTAAAVMLFALPGSLVAQTGRQITRDGFDSGAAGIRIDPGDSGKVQQFIQVTPVRTWRHVDGRTIEAALLGSRPEGKTEGRVELVALKGDKPAIRLLKGGKVYTFALEKLSEEDREHISKLDAAQGEREKEAVKGGNGQADLIS